MSDLTLAALVSFGIVVLFGIAVVANMVLSGWFGRRDDE
jgi:hypothetical protein